VTLPPKLEGAASEPVRLTVAELLKLFNERNRDFEIVGRIEQTLSEHGLCCEPALTEPSLALNSPVVVRANFGEQESSGPSDPAAQQEDPVTPATLLIGDLPTADLGGDLVSASPDEDLAEVLTRMMLANLSQLPVLSSASVLTGVVSWKSIVLAHARGEAKTLADVTQKDDVPEVRIDADLLASIPDIYAKDYVFVRALDQTICGIVTAADLSHEFGNLTGPYLRLGEIERRLRRCVGRMCADTQEDLRDATGNKKAATIHGLVLGDIEKVFRKPERWAKLGWGIHQDTFVARLESVRRTRNDVAHFRPDPITPKQRKELYTFAGWLKELVP
jgi:CBS domain-containing protein